MLLCFIQTASCVEADEHRFGGLSWNRKVAYDLSTSLIQEVRRLGLVIAGISEIKQWPLDCFIGVQVILKRVDRDVNCVFCVGQECCWSKTGLLTDAG